MGKGKAAERYAQLRLVTRLAERALTRRTDLRQGWRSVKEKIKISAKADKILLIYISLFFIN